MIGGWRGSAEASSDLGVLLRTPRFGFPKSREKRSTKNITVVFPSSRARAAFPAHSFFHTTTVCRVCHVTKEQTTTEKSSILIAEQVSTLPMFLKPNFISSVSTSPVDRNPGYEPGCRFANYDTRGGKNAGCSAAPLPSRQSTPRRRRTGRLAVASSQNTTLTCIARPLAERRRSIPLRPPATWRPVTSSRREMRTWTRSRFPGRCPRAPSQGRGRRQGDHVLS